MIVAVLWTPKICRNGDLHPLRPSEDRDGERMLSYCIVLFLVAGQANREECLLLESCEPGSSHSQMGCIFFFLLAFAFQS